MGYQAFEGEYQGERAVWLQAGPYEAAVLPGIGANLIAFRDKVKGYRMIREPLPEEMAEFRQRPMVHGIPVLFPPNRYEDGLMNIDGCQYVFPVNEESTGNHLHGFLYNRPWTEVEYGADAERSFVELSKRIDKTHEVYRYFPHHFQITLRYELSAQGLKQHVRVANQGQSPMPCMLGFHTAINAPFAASGSDCSITMTIGDRWELDDRMLPTGRTQPLTEGEAKLKTTGVSPFFAAMDNHYSAEPQQGRNRMVLTDAGERVRLVYDVGTGYTQWMIWNCGAVGGFFCPEPQINMVNAPNLRLPRETTGLVLLASGEEWSETSSLYLEEL